MYGTFNQICENYLNKDGELRDLYLNKILKNPTQNSNILGNIGSRVSGPRVLLIDEVDVFFSESFYGQVFVPRATIKSPEITQLIEDIWENKDDDNYPVKLETSKLYN